MLKEATLHCTSLLSHRIHAANEWRRFSRKHSQASEFEAAREVLNLLDLAVSESSSLNGLYGRLSADETFKTAHGTAAEAAALAIDGGDVTQAIAVLEQGRSIILTQLGRYRSAIEDVSNVSQDLAARFVNLSSSLNALVLSPKGIISESNALATDTGHFIDNSSR